MTFYDYIFILLFHCSLQCFYFQTPFCLGGDESERATPVPIPNTEVKPLNADGTAGEALWESRSLPPSFIFLNVLLCMLYK